MPDTIGNGPPIVDPSEQADSWALWSRNYLRWMNGLVDANFFLGAALGVIALFLAAAYAGGNTPVATAAPVAATQPAAPTHGPVPILTPHAPDLPMLYADAYQAVLSGGQWYMPPGKPMFSHPGRDYRMPLWNHGEVYLIPEPPPCFIPTPWFVHAKSWTGAELLAAGYHPLAILDRHAVCK